MSVSTRTREESFTRAHAKYITSKVATDLMRFSRLYGGTPSFTTINNYEAELIELLANDVVDWVEYGFMRDGKWTEAAVRYRALPGGQLSADDDPGKIRPGVNINGAHFTSFLTYNWKWMLLTPAQQDDITQTCPIKRGVGNEPGLEVGYWSNDLNYFAGGRGLGRSVPRR